MIEVLKVVNQQMDALNLNYEYGQMTKSPPDYPYWVGDYTEPEPMTEDGLEECTMILMGFARGSFMALEEQKAIINDYFKHGVTVQTEAGNVVVIFSAGSLNVPLEKSDLKKCQVNLLIKTWKGA